MNMIIMTMARRMMLMVASIPFQLFLHLLKEGSVSEKGKLVRPHRHPRGLHQFHRRKNLDRARKTLLRLLLHLIIVMVMITRTNTSTIERQSEAFSIITTLINTCNNAGHHSRCYRH